MNTYIYILQHIIYTHPKTHISDTYRQYTNTYIPNNSYTHSQTNILKFKHYARVHGFIATTMR